ncbi:MAG: alpha-L-fucosidase [Bacteroidales bacterium]|jgi:alpha-L-fucosidase
MKTLKIVALLFFGIFILNSTANCQETKPSFDENIKSIREHGYPKWFTDAKVGIFIHWGVYSVPSYAGRDKYAEWYLLGSIRGSKFNKNFEDKYYGENWDYKNYAPYLKGELFDANEWATLFKKAGAKYVILVSKHHDGFCMWQSKFAPNWNSVEVGLKRDIVGEVTTAVRDNGLKMGLYYSLPEWNNPIYRWVSDPPEKVHNYVETYMIPQFKELVSTYKPSLIFSDGDWDHNFSDWKSDELITWYYNLVGEDAVVNDRWGNNAPKNIGYKTPEYSAGLLNSEVPWTEVRGLGRSFGLNRNEPLEDYMTTTDLIHFLAKAVALGGGITINVGPAADGQIPLLQQERLLQLGEWLDINGEAIYASYPSDIKNIEVENVELNRIDPEIDFYWKRSSPGKPIEEDRFNAEWVGYIKPEHSETYHFSAIADDFIKLYIDDVCIYDSEKLGKLEKDTESYKNELQKSSVLLQKDKLVKLTAKFTENTHEAEAHVYWESKSTPKCIIPNSAVFTENNIKSANGFKAKYTSEMTTVCYTQTDNAKYAILLRYPNNNLINISVGNLKPGTKIKMLGCDKELPWTSKKGVTTVDLSSINISEIPSFYAWTLRVGE